MNPEPDLLSPLLLHTLVAAIWGGYVGYALARYLDAKRRHREALEAAREHLATLDAALGKAKSATRHEPDEFVDYAALYLDEGVAALADRWGMDLGDYHPADRLLDPDADPTTTTVLDSEGEPFEAPTPHEPTHEERDR